MACNLGAQRLMQEYHSLEKENRSRLGEEDRREEKGDKAEGARWREKGRREGKKEPLSS